MGSEEIEYYSTTYQSIRILRMCGRVACSIQSIVKAKEILSNALHDKYNTSNNNEGEERTTAKTETTGTCISTNRYNHDDSNVALQDTTKNHNLNVTFQSNPSLQNLQNVTFENNANLSPGMNTIIFHKDKKHITNIITCTEQRWGLIPTPGTIHNPINIHNKSQYFSNLMFNARSNTLYEKPTFQNIQNQTCIWFIDGYYEWKENDNDVVNNDKRKQPYFVHRKDGLPLIIAGLWTSVYTGRDGEKSGGVGKETLETFTILTTDAKSSLRWLHHRQPVFIHDVQLAIEWLLSPSKSLLEHILSSQANTSASGNHDEETVLAWHPVTKRMSNVNYEGYDCMEPIKIEKVKSIKSFFEIADKKKSTRTVSTHVATAQTVESNNSIKNESIIASTSNSTPTTSVVSNYLNNPKAYNRFSSPIKRKRDNTNSTKNTRINSNHASSIKSFLESPSTKKIKRESNNKQDNDTVLIDLTGSCSDDTKNSNIPLKSNSHSKDQKINTSSSFEITNFFKPMSKK